MITNPESGTRVDEIADGIYRISTPLRTMPGGFSFNQYLIVDDEPVLFHTGPRRLFPLTSQAIAAVMPLDRLRHIALSHVEADECGALNDLLGAAPQAQPLCSRVAALVSMVDLADRAPRAMDDGEVMSIGSRNVRWLDAPHVPHGWETGYMFDERTRTLLCGDLFTQGGADTEPLTESDILGPSEAFRAPMDYWAAARDTRAILRKLAGTNPVTLACMHGSAWRGEGSKLLIALGETVMAKG